MMFRPNRFVAWILVASLGFGGILPACALDPQEVLNAHDPTADRTLQEQKDTTALATATAAADPARDLFDRIFDRLLSVMERLVKLIGGLFELLAGKSGKTGKGKGSTTADKAKDGKGKTGKSGKDGKGTTDTSGSKEASKALENWKGGKLSPEKFAKLLGPAARESMKKTGVPASVTLAQAALETGWGGSTIGDAKNLFGIKGKGPAGTTTVSTKEFVNGRYITVKAGFRKYHTWQESIDDHAKLISGNSRYKNCMKNKDNPDQFAKELQKAGYATSPTYASTLISIMKKYDLYKWDK